MRIFLDANVLFSAAKTNGAIRAFLSVLKGSGHILVADAYVVGEARRNIETKFPAALLDFEKLLMDLETIAKASRPLEESIAGFLPEKDRPVLAAAFQQRCDILLTGDKTHFGPFYSKTIKGVEIQSPAGLAKKLDTP